MSLVEEGGLKQTVAFTGKELLPALTLARASNMKFFHLRYEDGLAFRDISECRTTFLEVAFKRAAPASFMGCRGIIELDYALRELGRLKLKPTDMIIYELDPPDEDGFSWGRLVCGGEVCGDGAPFKNGYHAEYYYDLLRYAEKTPRPTYRVSSYFRVGASALAKALKPLKSMLVVFEGGADGVFLQGLDMVDGSPVPSASKVPLDVRANIGFSNFTFDLEKLRLFASALARVNKTGVVEVELTDKHLLLIRASMDVFRLEYALAPYIVKGHEPRLL